MRTRSGTVICGAYGLGNLGDEAMLSALLASLGRLCPGAPVTVLSRSPSGGEVHAFDMARVLPAMRRSRLLIFGGGSLLQDGTSRRSLTYYLFILRAAKALGCRVLLYGCGVGPLSGGGMRRASRIVSVCADAAAARDAQSLAALRSMGLGEEKLRLMSDPALGLPPAPEAETARALRAAGIPDGARFAVLCPASGSGDFSAECRLYAGAALYLKREYALAPVCLPLGGGDDRVCREISRLSGGAAASVPHEGLSPALAAGITGRGAVTVSSRLHGLVFSASSGVPAVAAGGSPKLTAFARCMGYSCADVGEAAAETLMRSIDAALRSDPEAVRAAAAELKLENLRGEAAIKSLL